MSTGGEGSGDPSVHRYLSLRPEEFPLLGSLDLRQAYGAGGAVYGLSLRLELRAAESSDGRALVLSFLGVVGLRLDLSAAGVVMLSPLAVRPIRDRGREELGYEVGDAEWGGRVSFRCREFAAAVESE